MKRDNEEVRRASPGADRSSDPTAIATRRCLKLGGTSGTCIGKGFTSGLMDMIGLNTESLTGPRKAGVVLSGLYHIPATPASLNFGTDRVTISGCGKLVDEALGYGLAKGPNSLVLTVDNEPRPLVLTMRPDGGLSGPGAVDVKGNVIIGHHTVTSTLYVNGSPAVGGSCGGVCTTSTTVPDYAAKIERCTIGSLNPPPSPAATSAGNDSGLLGLLIGVAGSLEPPPLPGLRMSGQYGGSGLRLDFTEHSVILDCGQAHVRQPYTVENAPGTLLIHVQNSGGPFSLTILPDNTLRGSGSTTVNGRLVSGMQGDAVAYTPRSERCEVATFAASSPGAAGPSSSGPAAPATSIAVSARLSIASAFPAGPNPLVGKAIFLYKDSFTNVARKAGATVAPGATPGQALRGFLMSCRPPGDCSAVNAAMEPLIAGRASIGSTGRATVTPLLPPGRYFVSGAARSGAGVLVWDVPVDLKPGDNSVVLEPGNAESVR